MKETVGVLCQKCNLATPAIRWIRSGAEDQLSYTCWHCGHEVEFSPRTEKKEEVGWVSQHRILSFTYALDYAIRGKDYDQTR